MHACGVQGEAEPLKRLRPFAARVECPPYLRELNAHDSRRHERENTTVSCVKGLEWSTKKRKAICHYDVKHSVPPPALISPWRLHHTLCTINITSCWLDFLPTSCDMYILPVPPNLLFLKQMTREKITNAVERGSQPIDHMGTGAICRRTKEHEGVIRVLGYYTSDTNCYYMSITYPCCHKLVVCPSKLTPSISLISSFVNLHPKALQLLSACSGFLTPTTGVMPLHIL